MPIFEYACDDCHAEVELLVRDGRIPECPECSSRSLTKRLSVPSIGKSTAPSVGGRCDTSLPPCSPKCCRINS